MDRVAEPLRRMGALVECRDGRLPPMTVEGAELRGIRYELPVASAQVKSCVLLAGLLAEGATTVVEPLPTRDHTERMLTAAGAAVERDAGRVTVRPPDRLELGEIDVPGDISSAAFFIVAAVLVPGVAHRPAGGRGESHQNGPARRDGADGRRGRDDRRALHRRRAGRRPVGRARRACGHHRDGAGGAVADRRASPGGAARGLCEGRDRGGGRRGAASQGVRPNCDRDGRAGGAGRGHRGTPGRLRGPRDGRAARGRHRRGWRPPPGDARRGRRRGFAGGRGGDRVRCGFRLVSRVCRGLGEAVPDEFCTAPGYISPSVAEENSAPPRIQAPSEHASPGQREQMSRRRRRVAGLGAGQSCPGLCS